MKKLIATDFDGTFLRNGVIDPGYHTAIRDFRKAGGLFGFVTGRGTDFFDTIREYGVTADYLLLYNGALLALPDGTVVKESLIPRETYAALEAFFAAIPDTCEYGRAGEAAFYHQYFAWYDTVGRSVEVAAEAERIFGDRVAVLVNGHHINIVKKGCGKARGVRDALDYFGLREAEAAVFGDDFNDLDMITALDGWAVKTARPEVLAKAPHVCESVSAQAKIFLSENQQSNP
jgi:hypothetical protein